MSGSGLWDEPSIVMGLTVDGIKGPVITEEDLSIEKPSRWPEEIIESTEKYFQEKGEAYSPITMDMVDEYLANGGPIVGEYSRLYIKWILQERYKEDEA